MGNRILKINQLIKKELSNLFLKEFDLPQEIFLTISKVETTKDLSLAKIEISIWPENQEKKILIFLEKKTSKIRKLLAGKLKIFRMPQIIFSLDKSEEKRKRIDEILENISNQ